MGFPLDVTLDFLLQNLNPISNLSTDIGRLSSLETLSTPLMKSFILNLALKQLFFSR